MIRKIIKINEDACVGCGACINACHEGAIAMVNGKAKLVRDDYCDGLGNCLPACPTGAITFEEREAATFDEKAVKEHNAAQKEALLCGCPGTMTRVIDRKTPLPQELNEETSKENFDYISQLRQWPVQIQLVPVKSQYFQNADLLVAADCTAFAYGNFHETFLKNHTVLIGCPKLDDVDYTEKLTEILKSNELRSITVVRMEVPCCRGIEIAVKEAILRSQKIVPFKIIIISVEGKIQS
jgi:ferredoxin